MNKILVILGPTATGKSDLAVKVAKKYNGEIISADSRQVYKGLDIGSGKITKREMSGVRHHMLDVISPKKTYSVVDWQKETKKVIKDILERKKLPIICGGTGFYVQSIVQNFTLPEVKVDKKLRKELVNENLDKLLKILKKMDLERFKKIDQKNKVRVIRAIEIAKALGKVPEIKKDKNPYDIFQIGLILSKEDLEQKIKERLQKRIEKGMIKEGEKLHKEGLAWKRMRELGLEYKYLANFLMGKIDKNKMISDLVKEIIQYSKRQMTWFKRDKNIKWFKPTDFKTINKEIKSFLNN
ncbi:MAG: tRNA (adenosine(37)-N6)-dimethylallyltransferase MiaA [Candidatus Paceibacterota bacterium]